MLNYAYEMVSKLVFTKFQSSVKELKESKRIISKKKFWAKKSRDFIFLFLKITKGLKVKPNENARAGNLLIGFLSELLVFCKKNERMSNSLQKASNSLIHSFLVSNLSD